VSIGAPPRLQEVIAAHASSQVEFVVVVVPPALVPEPLGSLHAISEAESARTMMDAWAMR
jgi:hypothetical protein